MPDSILESMLDMGLKAKGLKNINNNNNNYKAGLKNINNNNFDNAGLKSIINNNYHKPGLKSMWPPGCGSYLSLLIIIIIPLGFLPVIINNDHYSFWVPTCRY